MLGLDTELAFCSRNLEGPGAGVAAQHSGHPVRTEMGAEKSMQLMWVSKKGEEPLLVLSWAFIWFKVDSYYSGLHLNLWNTFQDS